MFGLGLEDILREFQEKEGKAAADPKWREFFNAICQDAIRISMELLPVPYPRGNQGNYGQADREKDR